jgi:hypothetical protein
VVDEGAAVAVAVECGAEVRALGDDPGLEIPEVLRLERIGFMVGEAAVRIDEERDQEQPRQAGHEVLEHGPDHAVAAVDNDLERPIQAQDRGEEGGVGIGDEGVIDAAAWCRGGGAGTGQALDLFHARSGAHGLPAGPGDLGAAVRAQVVHGKGEAGGRYQADVDHAHPGCHQASDEA